jgi:hypothetical protein
MKAEMMNIGGSSSVYQYYNSAKQKTFAVKDYNYLMMNPLLSMKFKIFNITFIQELLVLKGLKLGWNVKDRTLSSYLI